FRILQNVLKHLEDIIEVALEAGKTDDSGVDAAASLHTRGALLKEIVQFVSGLRLGPSSAPYFAVNIDHAGLPGSHAARSSSDARNAVDQGKFVILLKKHDHAVGENDPLRLRGMKRRKRRNRDIFPVGDLRMQRKSTRQEHEYQKRNRGAPHWAP